MNPNYVQHTVNEKLSAFERLLTIMDDLRAKCPWDKTQTLESLRTLTIEEVYELADSIVQQDITGLRKELGDVLLHIVFYAKIGSETNDFDIADVINSLCDKLIYRHPHIYSDVLVKDANEVVQNWEQLKLKEKESTGTVLGGIPASLPAMIKAYRIQDKVRGVGFDWDFREQVWDKVTEEINELKYEVTVNDHDKIEAEFGDLLFSLINAARLYDINPENALERTNQKFIKRFQYLESEAKKDGKSLKTMNVEEMDVYWNRAKAFDK